jgi:hypothetical protein
VVIGLYFVFEQDSVSTVWIERRHIEHMLCCLKRRRVFVTAITKSAQSVVDIFDELFRNWGRTVHVEVDSIALDDTRDGCFLKSNL